MVKRGSDGWGPWVKKRTGFLGLKLAHVAGFVDTTPGNFSKWLRSKTMPRLSQVKREKLADILNVERYELPIVHETADYDYPGYIESSVAKDAYRSSPNTPKESDILANKLKHNEEITRLMIYSISGLLSGKTLEGLSFDAMERARQAGLADDYIYRAIGKMDSLIREAVIKKKEKA